MQKMMPLLKKKKKILRKIYLNYETFTQDKILVCFANSLSLEANSNFHERDLEITWMVNFSVILPIFIIYKHLLNLHEFF